jgi:hypothetical protein
MSSVFDEETRRAKLYRDNWDARIAYRAGQLRTLSGSLKALDELWEDYLPVYSPFNYVEGEEQNEFFTPYDIDDDGSLSSSEVRLRGTEHAGESHAHRIRSGD